MWQKYINILLSLAATSPDPAFLKELYSTVKCTLITGFYLGREGPEKLYH